MGGDIAVVVILLCATIGRGSCRRVAVLECHSDGFNVFIPTNSSTPNQHPTLRASECISDNRGSSWHVSSTYDKCGTSLREGDTYKIYSNEIIFNERLSTERHVTRREHVACFHDKINGHFTPFVLTSTSLMQDNNDGSAHPMEISLSSASNTEAEYGPILPTSIGERMEFNLVPLSIELGVSASSCFLTPSPNQEHPMKYYLIKDGRFVDDTIKAEGRSQHAASYSFETFSFVNANSSLLYLHCKCHWCYLPSSNSVLDDYHCRHRLRDDGADQLKSMDYVTALIILR